MYPYNAAQALRVKEPVEDAQRGGVDFADISAAALAMKLHAHQGGLGASTSRSIPWYIIDPTGDMIRDQRTLWVKHTKETGKRPPFWDRVLLYSPTLYPAWDLITALALIYTALVTPFESAFLKPPKVPQSDPLWLMDRVVDTIFLLDIVSQCFTMRLVPAAKGANTENEWETNLRRLAWAYLTSLWFPLDVVSMLPSTIDVLATADGSKSEDGAHIGFLKSLRTLRLIKLARLFKTSRVVRTLMEFVSISSTTRALISLATQSLLLTHWYACVLMIMAIFASSPYPTFLAAFGYCEPIAEQSSGPATDLHDADNWHCVDTAYMYLQMAWWAMGLVFHNGFPIKPSHGPFEPTVDESDIYLQPYTLTAAEQGAVMAMKLVGLGFWSVIISKLIRSVTLLANPVYVAYHQDQDSVNRFCNFNRLPGRLSRELRRYMRNTLSVHESRNRALIYSKLSPLLVIKVTKVRWLPLELRAWLWCPVANPSRSLWIRSRFTATQPRDLQVGSDQARARKIDGSRWRPFCQPPDQCIDVCTLSASR